MHLDYCSAITETNCALLNATAMKSRGSTTTHICSLWGSLPLFAQIDCINSSLFGNCDAFQGLTYSLGGWVVFRIFSQVKNKGSYTVEPPNKGHVGTRGFVLYREVFFIRRLKCTGIIGIGTSRFVLYREVVFFRSVLYWRFHCIPYYLYTIYHYPLLYTVLYRL